MAATGSASITPSARQRPGLVPFVLLFVLGISFGAIFTLNRLATTNGVPFIPYLFWQALGGAVALLVLCAGLRQLPPIGFTHVRIYVVMAILNVLIPVCVFSFVAPKVPASLLPIGLSLVPMFIYAMALGLRMEKFHWLRFVGLTLGFGGVLLVLLPKASLPSPDMVGWIALSLIAPFSYALRSVLIPRLRPPQTTSLRLACGLLVAAAVIMLPVFFATDDRWAFDGAFGIGHWAVLGAMAHNALTLVLIFELVRLAGPVFFGTSNYIAMLVGVAMGMTVFGERQSLWIWAALALVVLGLYLVNKRVTARGG